MKKTYKDLIRNLLIIAIAAVPLMVTANEGARKAANELLKVVRFEKIMDDSINGAVQTIKQMDPNMSKHETAIRDFYQKYMGAESLYKEVADIYAEVFTENELKEIVAFYKTKTGQKTLEKIPEIMQRSMKMGQTRVMQNMGELKQLLEKEQTAK